MALAVMLKWAGTRYDPVLLQLLVNALGAYPPGTLLKLGDGRVVRSVAPPEEPGDVRPPARPLSAAGGRLAGPADLQVLDLRGVGGLQVLRALP
jgi:hypothetical protein